MGERMNDIAAIPGFIDPFAAEPVAAMLRDVLDALPAIRAEGVAALPIYSRSPEIHIQNPADIKLFILPLKWHGRMVDDPLIGFDGNSRWRPAATGQEMLTAAPTLSQILRKHSVVRSALYSCSMPGCEITPHADNENSIGDVYRIHVGIDCPPGDCALCVGEECRPWESGGVMMFDSPRTVHSAYNRSNRPRMILIMDVDGPAVRESVLL